MAGLRVKLNENFSFGVEYKYLQTEDSSFRYEAWHAPDVLLDWKGLRAHTVTASLTINF